nr:uncharacterized protein LOC127346667 [Lolium perenne]
MTGGTFYVRGPTVRGRQIERAPNPVRSPPLLSSSIPCAPQAAATIDHEPPPSPCLAPSRLLLCDSEPPPSRISASTHPTLRWDGGGGARIRKRRALVCALDFFQRRLPACPRFRPTAAGRALAAKGGNRAVVAALALDFVRASSGGGREQKRRAGGGRQQSSDGGGGWTVRALDFFLGTPGVEMLSVASIVGRLASPSCTPSVDSRRRALVHHALSPLQPPALMLMKLKR